MLWGKFVVLAVCALSRRLTGSFRVSPVEKDERVYYISKFACDIGECQYNVRAAVKHPEWALQRASGKTFAEVKNLVKSANSTNARLVIRVVLDDEWDTSHRLSACRRAELGRGRTTLTVPLDGTFGPWSTNSFRQSHRPHFWYFFAEDCRNNITTQLAKLVSADDQAASIASMEQNFPAYELIYEIEMLQTDGGHLSFEYKGMWRWNLLQVLLYVGFLAWMHYKQVRVMKQQRFSLHLMVQILNASCILHLAGAILSCYHLYQVNKTGASFELLDGICESCFTISHIAISSCLILIALGITLNAPQNKLPISIIKVMGAVICLAHFIVVLIDKYVSDPRYKYYGTEGHVGWILVVFRFGLFGVYLVCFKLTIEDPSTPAATQRFLKRILIPSSLYFLTMPTLVVLTTFIRPYLRHAFLFHAMCLTHIIACVWLSELFLSKGEYFKVSQMSQSFLPGGVWRPSVAPHHVD